MKHLLITTIILLYSASSYSKETAKSQEAHALATMSMAYNISYYEICKNQFPEKRSTLSNLALSWLYQNNEALSNAYKYRRAENITYELVDILNKSVIKSLNNSSREERIKLCSNHFITISNKTNLIKKMSPSASSILSKYSNLYKTTTFESLLGCLTAGQHMKKDFSDNYNNCINRHS